MAACRAHGVPLCERYGYVEVRTPVIEREELFAKGTGETTDIVQKEMYTFTDKGGERVTLRPEATPSMVRAYVEHNLEHALPAAKLYSMGPMFRYERPQKGRYRQFHQLDVEVFGMHDPAVDAEVIDLAWSLIDELGIPEAELVINSVGMRHLPAALSGGAARRARPGPAAAVRGLPAAGGDQPAAHLRLQGGADQPIIDALPHSVDYLCEPCATHFSAVRGQLDAWAIPWRVSHRLVRGLDYYTRTTFEVLGRTLGAQNALLGGGRYDGLVKTLGGPDRTGIGFAAGLERLVLALPDDAVSLTAAGVRRGDWRRGRGAKRCGCCGNCDRPVSRRRWSSKREASGADEAGRPARGARDTHRRWRRTGPR